jgi:ribosomal protein S18 acetylase RimI-like enzyme
MDDRLQLQELEERALNAWPARQSVLFGGWVFRISGGFTKRANSANAIHPTAPFDDVRSAAETLYARHSLPAIFRVSPLAGAEADRELERAGYQVFDPSLVMTAPVEQSGLPAEVEITEAPTGPWLEGIAAANAVTERQREIHDLMVSLIPMQTAFATLRHGGEAVGFGLAVREGDYVGLFDIVVSPASRGRGCGLALTEALLGWGRRAGASQAYLQVRADNEAACRLYTRLGFRCAYRYHYRIPVML